MENQFAAWRCRVDLLGQTDELDVSLLKSIEHINEMLQGTACAVELPNDQGVAWTQKASF